jgi:hypothetical protein
VSSAISGPAPVEGLAFFRAQGRADRVSLDGTGGFCRVPERERVIFDSLVADFEGEIGDEQSQQTLNCALFRQLRSNSGRVSLIQNFAGFTTGRRLKIGRTLRRGF